MDDDVVILAGYERDRRSIPLATKRGRHIPNVQRRERAPDSLRAAIAEWGRLRPDAIFRTISNCYNCAGMAFAVRRTWIDTEHLGQIYEEDGYRTSRVGELGDIVVYRDQKGDIQHVAIVIAVEIDLATGNRSLMVLSKWGGDGEYVHPIDHVPESFGRVTEFWTDRLEAP